MELFKLMGTIAVNNSDANQAIDESSGKAEGLAGKLQSAGSKVSEFGSKVSDVGGKLTKGITLPAIAAGGAIFAFAGKSASAADNIDKMSQKIGISREAYQELDFICSQSGTSVDNLQAGMKTLTTQLTNAANGSAASAEMFEKLGVSVTNADGSMRSQEDVMFDTMAALQGMENQTEKARLATQLFGRSGTELMPLLNGAAGSIDDMKQQAHDLGLVMSDEAVDAGVEYTDKLDQVKRSFAAAAAEAGTKMLPILTKLGDWLIEKGVPAFEKLIGYVEKAFNWFESLDSGTQKLILTIAGIVVAIGPVLTVVGKVISIGGTVMSIGSKVITMIAGFNPVVLGVIAVIAALIAIGVLLYKNWDKIKAAASKLKNNIVKIFNGMKTSVIKIFTNIKDGIKQKVEAVKSNVTSTFNKVKDAMLKPVEKARDSIKKVVDKIKGFFNFEFKIPKIKLPHISISPSGWKVSDLLKGSIPKLGIDWYAKAMDNPMLMTRPTAFGVNANGQIMAGGEKGSEVVSGTDTLMNMISQAVAAQNSGMNEALNKILDLLAEYVPDMANTQIVMDSGALVGTLTPAIDRQLGQTMKLKARGV